MRSTLCMAAILVCVLLASTANAEKRIALVIGNSTYQNVAPLDNPKNDAALMARTLKELGFTLVGGAAQLNLDKAALDRAVQSFGQQLPGADVALFYYAGHGIQLRGSNYLVPVNANPTREADVDFQLLDVELVLRQMEASGTRLNLLILDACRNNPFGGRGLRGSEPGLAQMRAPEGTLISYATQPGNVAQDGADGDSPYTKALATTMRRPGLDLFQTFNQVGVAVAHATGGSQQPWISSSPIDGNFYFTGPTIADKETLTSPGTNTQPAKPTDTMRLDLVTDCDRLAASSRDPSRPRGIDGVEMMNIDTVPALTACRDAMRQYPDVARFVFQAGRIATAQKDAVRARQLYEQAASLGSGTAMVNLGAMSLAGDGIAKDPVAARKWFEMAANSGVAAGTTGIGNLYLRGEGVPADPVQARTLFERAAAAGDATAMLELGALYDKGQGVKADYVAARKWYEKAADRGNAVALTSIGDLYLFGKGVAASPAEARKWYERAAAANVPGAMYALGVMYEQGTAGEPKDYAKARTLYEKSASLGFPKAMCHLGNWYHVGIGDPVSYSEARGWYEKGAALGEANCMTNLGVLYENGQGVAADSALARQWYEKAASTGGDDAKAVDAAKAALKRLSSTQH
jgi:TPR repeat protein